MMVTSVIRKKEMFIAGLRSIWKKIPKKYFILEEYVKNNNFVQNWFLWYYKEQMYIKVIVDIELNLNNRFARDYVSYVKNII